MNENKNIGSDYRQIKDVINQNLDVVFFGVLFMLIDTKKKYAVYLWDHFYQMYHFSIYSLWMINYLTFRILHVHFTPIAGNRFSFMIFSH